MADPAPISNQPENLDMNTVLAVSRQYGGFAKTCRYIVRIIPQGDKLIQKMSRGGQRGYNGLSYMCEAAEIPGRGFQNIDVRYYGPSFKLPVSSQYEDVSLTFLCRSESFERQFFDDWMEIINPSTTWNFAYRDSYIAEVQIFQLADYAEKKAQNTSQTTPKAVYSWSLLNSYPLVINPQAVTWADDNYQRLTVVFTYSKWTRPDKDEKPSSIYRDTNTFVKDSPSQLTPLPLPKTGL